MRLMHDLVGEVFSDRYRLIARLAGGGMGDVYRGHDLLLDRAVAVKVLQPSLSTEPELVERFKSEARAAARLSHPNVVAVYDWGAHDDRIYYMIMEYVSGSDLRDVLVTRGPLEPAQAVGIMIPVCEALHEAHRNGLIHRDVKPENILISRSSEVKVADFGIAVIADADRTVPGGAIPGTLRYVAPEQARGEEATVASDVWAAGVILFELLTGAPPLRATGAELVRRRAAEPVPAPSSVERSVPRDLDGIVRRACALEPSERFADAGEMTEALAGVAPSLARAPAVTDLLDELTGEIVLPDMDPTFFAPHRRRRRGAKRFRRFLLALVAAVVLVGGWKAVPALTGPRMVDVPRLVGLSIGAGTERAEAAGLRVDVVARYHRFDAPKGEILTQSPARGDLEEGTAVEVAVSAGLPWADVPEVVEAPLPQAKVRLRAAGLEVGEIRARFSPTSEGTVITQSPADGRLRWGSPVALVVSKGPHPIEVPSVAQLPLTKAKKLLEDAGFTPVVKKTYSDDLRKGLVLGTTPAGGATAVPGTEITVVVSIGPEFQPVKMPDVRNMPVDKAKARLEALGLHVRVFQSCGNRGTTVAETDPIAGTMIREGDSVALFVC